MRSDVVVVASIGSQDPPQVRLTQFNDMVHALAADRSDQPFSEGVLPRRGWGDWLVTDAHGANSTRNGCAVDAIPIADQVVRSIIPRECLHDLACDPFRGRI